MVIAPPGHVNAPLQVDESGLLLQAISQATASVDLIVSYHLMRYLQFQVRVCGRS